MNNSARTAIARSGPSIPLRLALKYDAFPNWGYLILDWGCGKGADVEYLRSIGRYAVGYDPYHGPSFPHNTLFSCIMCSYVLNVIDNQDERTKLITDIYNTLRPGGRVVFGIRSFNEIEVAAHKSSWKPFSDGWMTKSGTFQKGFLFSEIHRQLKEQGFINIKKVIDNPLVIRAEKGY